MSYYLRFEAVNLGNFIYDTNDLSTIRGGGLLLLNAPDEVEKIIKKKLPNPNPITKGASNALFELDADENTVLDIKQDIFRELKAEIYDNKPSPFRHATFVVDVLQQTKSFKEDRDSLLTLNRWQQMQSPSLSIPKPDNEVCALDKVRPGSEKDYSIKPGKTVMLSPSVALRRKYGKSQKRGEFYKSRTGFDLEFTNDLAELSNDPKRGILKDKIAVIYLDGNKFGDVVKALKEPKLLKKFESKLREAQTDILSALLDVASKNETSLWKLGDKIRLETLLWGGDELIWVVPAWLGWFTLNFFYKQVEECMRSEHLKPRNYPSLNGKLSFAAGLVFCHHNAPIHRITRLAKNLAQISKDIEAYQYQNTVAYQILESFDHAGIDGDALENYRKKRLGNLGEVEQLLVAAENMENMEIQLQTLKNNNFPRRKSYQIIQACFANNEEQAKELQEKMLEDVSPEEKANIENALNELKKLCGGNYAHWLHLTDLWDYLALETNDHV